MFLVRNLLFILNFNIVLLNDKWASTSHKVSIAGSSAYMYTTSSLANIDTAQFNRNREPAATVAAVLTKNNNMIIFLSFVQRFKILGSNHSVL